MRLANMWKCVVALAVSLVLVGTANAGGNAAVSKGKGLIQEEQKLIVFFAHPTAKYQSMSHESTTNVGNGFQLNYRLNYTGVFGVSFYSTLGFVFDRDGNLQSINTVATSSIVDRFVGADLVLNELRDELLRDPDIRNSATARGIIERADARGILTFLLKTSR